MPEKKNISNSSVLEFMFRKKGIDRFLLSSVRKKTFARLIRKAREGTHQLKTVY